ncbi:MAG: hypothetical protein RAO92_06970 [Candidatus Euphemobacter frigidus]|nr:hypothetical protein [Candidatus Euphemobacter frigidus]MDP8276128.1 hypothetical protein [Candidatus Euphemobacter frigidus]
MVFYFYIGVILIAGGMVNSWFGSPRLADWTTPACWWGYILILDAVIYRIRGKSIIRNNIRLFIYQCVFSVLFWGVFELNNLHLRNWAYVDLPPNPWETAVGMALSFATIMPGLFYTAELIDISGLFKKIKLPPLRISPVFAYILILLGMIFLVLPMMLPPTIATYLFIMIWLGWIFFLDPVNLYSGTRSILADLTQGEGSRIAALFASGVVCGLLWEFWNFWAGSKWVYTAPFMPEIKIFEMPVVGFLGFLPFAVEYFVVYHTARLIFGKSIPGGKSLDYRIFD